MKIRTRQGKKGTVVETFDDGYAVLLDRKRDKNYKHHKTEYVVYVRKADER